MSAGDPLHPPEGSRHEGLWNSFWIPMIALDSDFLSDGLLLVLDPPEPAGGVKENVLFKQTSARSRENPLHLQSVVFPTAPEHLAANPPTGPT